MRTIARMSPTCSGSRGVWGYGVTCGRPVEDVAHQNVEDRVAAAPVPVSVEEPLHLGARPRLRPRVARPKLEQIGLAARRGSRAGQLEAPAKRESGGDRVDALKDCHLAHLQRVTWWAVRAGVT